MGRKRILPMLSFHGQGLFGRSVFAALQKRSKELRPVFFSPCTLGRTWGTRSGRRASFLALASATRLVRISDLPCSHREGARQLRRSTRLTCRIARSNRKAG